MTTGISRTVCMDESFSGQRFEPDPSTLNSEKPQVSIPQIISSPTSKDSPPASSARADSTWSLRQKLGFHDDTLWKQLSTRRLEFIYSMRLNLRKASEQEREITAVASQLCAEYGYSGDSLEDFEKLVRAGVQSVRRNQRRPTKSRHFELNPANVVTTHASVSPSMSPPLRVPPVETKSLPEISDLLPENLPHLRSGPMILPPTVPPTPEAELDGSYVSPLVSVLDDIREAALETEDLDMPPAAASLIAAGILRTSIGLAAVQKSVSCPHSPCALLVSVESGLVGDALSQIVSSREPRQSFLTIVAAMAQRDYNKTLTILKNLSSSFLAFPDHSVAKILDVLAKIRAARVGTSPPHTGSPLSISARMTPTPQGVQVESMNVESQDTVIPMITAKAESDIPGMWDVRQVKLRYGQHTHEFAYTPAKNTAPTMGEIIENGRTLFQLPANSIVRVRDLNRGTIIDSNTELAETFLRAVVDIELFLPPPPMHPRVSMSSGGFAPVAPDLRGW